MKLIRIELRELVEIAKIQSTEASNRIEGISTADDRLKNLVQAKTTPRNRDESEIAGYRDVLNTIHENYDYIPINANYLLQLHRDLYKFLGNTEGGTFKTGDNIIREMDAEGNQHVRFMPIAAWETPDAIDELCNSFRDAKEIVDPLILDMMFILDFLCIHPFNDGNGRMSRLLTLLLLYQSGFIVGKYVSIEKIIEESKETYYIRQHQDNVAIAKLKTNQPLTETDIETLEEILWKEVGTKQDYEHEIGTKPLGEFVREIVGLDMNAAKEAFSEYLTSTSLDSRQIYFVNQIVEYIVHNGMMKDLSVLQESPFTDQGSVVEIFTDLTVWMGIRKVIESINANAAA